jgi:PhoH-like ATPase
MRLQRPPLRPPSRAAAPASRARLPTARPQQDRSIGWRRQRPPQRQGRCRSTAKPADAAAKPARRARNTRTGPTTLFVLDTNVLLHDPSSLFRFEEHDIFLPMVVLEELDNHKRA